MNFEYKLYSIYFEVLVANVITKLLLSIISINFASGSWNNGNIHVSLMMPTCDKCCLYSNIIMKNDTSISSGKNSLRNTHMEEMSFMCGLRLPICSSLSNVMPSSVGPNSHAKCVIRISLASVKIYFFEK